MKYRRVFRPGGTYFFTVNTHKRQKLFLNAGNVELLRMSMRTVMECQPFKIVAAVILPDHIHAIWTLPPGDADFPNRWRMIKGNFTRNLKCKPIIGQSQSRINKGEQFVWQRRFWEHLIRDESDLTNHIEYIHFNPVKHGLVSSPADWAYTSFLEYVKNGLYTVDWGANQELKFEDIGKE